MSDRHEELLAKYLDGEISVTEAAELLASVRSNPQELFRLRRLMELDEQLRQASIQDESGEHLARAVMAQLDASASDTAFVRRVITHLPPRTDRITRRRGQFPGSPTTQLPLILSAAAVLIFILTMILANTRPAPVETAIRPPERVVRSPEMKNPDPEAPTTHHPIAPVAERPPKPAPEVRPEAPTPLVPEPPLPGKTADPVVARKEAPPTLVEVPQIAGTFEEVSGEVFSVTGASRVPVQAGSTLPLGAGVEGRGSAALSFADGTRLEIQSNSKVESIATGGKDEGKRVVLKSGSVAAIVAPQPAGRPLVLQVPQGKIEVLGTFLRVGIEGAAARVEVWNGQVKAIKTDGTAALVHAGQGTVLGPGISMAPQPLSPPKSPVAFASLWMPENGNPHWKAAVDGRAKVLSFSSVIPEAETFARIWSAGTWNLVQGNLKASMELVPDPKGPEEEGKRHELVLRIIEGRNAGPDQWVEIALTSGGVVEARINGKERSLGSLSVRDQFKARRSLPLDFDLTETTLRLSVGGRVVFSGPHQLPGYGIVRVSFTGTVHEAGATSSTRILNPQILYIPNGK